MNLHTTWRNWFLKTQDAVQKKDDSPVLGNDDSTIFIFARTEGAFQNAENNLREHLPERGKDMHFVFCNDLTAFEHIKLYENPIFWLADDWFELDLIQSPLFRLLMCNRRIR